MTARWRTQLARFSHEWWWGALLGCKVWSPKIQIKQTDAFCRITFRSLWWLVWLANASSKRLKLFHRKRVWLQIGSNLAPNTLPSAFKALRASIWDSWTSQFQCLDHQFERFAQTNIIQKIIQLGPIWLPISKLGVDLVSWIRRAINRDSLLEKTGFRMNIQRNKTTLFKSSLMVLLIGRSKSQPIRVGSTNLVQRSFKTLAKML